MSQNEIEALRRAIKRLHGCEAQYVRTETVIETYEGKPIWQGKVNVFTIQGHDEATRCHAWSFTNDRSKTERVAVLELPPVVDASTAVQAYLASLQK